MMADGSVRWIPANIDPKVLRALATRAGGDNADLADVDKVAPKIESPKSEPAEVKKPEEKKPEEKKPDDKDKKATDPKATDPKKPVDKKDAGAKVDPAPTPKEK
jgi:hypothetical protein